MRSYSLSFFCMMALVIMNSCSNEIISMTKRIADRGPKYYMLQKNGDTVLATNNETKKIGKKNLCINCEIPDSAIIEFSCKQGVAKWTGYKWMIYLVKGKVNVYVAFMTSSYSNGVSYSAASGTVKAETATANVMTDCYFEKDNSGLIDIKYNTGFIRRALSDNPFCAAEFNKLVPDGKTIQDKNYMKLFKIMERYNQQ